MVSHSPAPVRGLKSSCRVRLILCSHSFNPDDLIQSNLRLLAGCTFTAVLHFLSPVASRAKTEISKISKTTQTLGDHIRKRRLELGLFQRQVAEKIGVDMMTIWNWECNESSPQIQFFPAIIKFLDYNLFPLPDSPRRSLVFYVRCLA